MSIITLTVFVGVGVRVKAVCPFVTLLGMNKVSPPVPKPVLPDAPTKPVEPMRPVTP